MTPPPASCATAEVDPYAIATASSLWDLRLGVLEMMRSGYEPSGPISQVKEKRVVAHRFSVDVDVFCQPMVRRSPAPEGGAE